jgi:uncharacterized protein YkwD
MRRTSRRGPSCSRPSLLAFASAGACICALLIGAGPGASAGGRVTLSTQTVLEIATVDQINSVRAKHGLAPLSFSQALFASALLHDRQMVGGGYFGHQGPDGSDFSSRIEQSYPPGSSVYYAIGENLYWSQGPVSSGSLISRWMQSAEHRENLLNPNWRQVAVAVLTVPTAPGVFGNRPVTVVTVDFGVRR